jgi:hypothetical protein
LSTDADHEEPSRDFSTWAIERLRAFATNAQGQHLEAVRVVAQAHAHRSAEPREARQQWAKLSLQANQRLHGEGRRDRARAAQQNFMLRMWIIDQFGANDEDPDWNPERLAADTVAVLALAPSEARTLADNLRGLAAKQIAELRRHKNLTAHLGSLVKYLQPSPTRDQLLAWAETRQHLP